MIDHIGFPVSDYARAKAFYAKALAPLGYSLIMEVTQEQTGRDPAAGFGANGKPDFWIGGEGGLNKPLHVAIVAKDRATVAAFYQAAMAAGGRDNGAPGVRAHYHPNYYGAFVLDPDGHNIEAVCHAPERSVQTCPGRGNLPVSAPLSLQHAEERQYEGGAVVPIEPQEDPPIKPGQPSEPPQESPPGGPRPEVPPPMQEPGEPPRPEELPGNTPDELPVRGPGGPGPPSPAADAGIGDLSGPGPDLNPGAADMPQGTM